MTNTPDTGPPAQPTNETPTEAYGRLTEGPMDLYRVDLTNSKTPSTRVRFSAATEDEADATALGIVDDHGADYGDIYKHGRWSCDFIHHSTVGPCPDNALTRDDIIAAIVDGDRTEQQIRDRFGVKLDRLLKAGSLFHLLHGLVMDDLLFMVDEFGTSGWLYKPTKKGRALVASAAA